MSHTTIYFLAEGEDLLDAEERVSAYLEGETFYDSSTVMDELSGSLSEKRDTLNKFLNGWEWKEAADDLFAQAEKHKTDGELFSFGYKLIKAGELYAQYLTIDTYIFNIDTSNYSIPIKDEGWWTIAVDFHY